MRLKLSLGQRQITRAAGVMVWLVTGAFLAILSGDPLLHDANIGVAQLGLAWLAYLIYGIVFWAMSACIQAAPPRQWVVSLTLLSVLPPIIAYLVHADVGAFLVFNTAFLVPWMVSVRIGVGWLLVQNILVTGAFITGTGPLLPHLVDVVLVAAIHLGFSAFVFSMALVAMREARARLVLRKLNAELRATQSLLHESSQIGERLRISRELHDLVGHHLTALSLNLEVASHVTRGKALQHVQQCQSLARLLLSDVRDVVSNMRSENRMDLRTALSELAEGVPGLTVHMRFPDEFGLEHANQAQALLRCVQEIITNTMKHANAKNLWLEFQRDEGSISFESRDDGRGVAKVTTGNGLRGMRERLRAFGGDLAIESRIGRGFCVNGWMPDGVAA